MIKNTAKQLFLGALCIAASITSLTALAESSVWKVSKGNDHIFIGGTVHILPASEFPLPAEFEQAYQKSNIIVLEAKLPDASDTDFQMKMMQQMAYGQNKTIGDFLSAKTKQNLSQYISALGVDLMMFERFKPGFLMTMLALLEAQKAGLSGEGVDIFYSNKAKKDNKKLAYLEIAEFQMNMIANMGVGNEEKFVKSNLEQMKDFKSMFLGLLKAWRAGDEKQLNTLAIEPMKDDPNTIKTLLTDRNKNWIPHIEQMFSGNRSDKELVLVGVAHLAGNNSVLALLKAKGYRVEKL
ncbi:TraB/GumN family protein [Colwellia psychrerythraea]|uniref:TraB determinant protein n=1 Tax=Colwellia psychrerythraea TaxID=28229 RepID=A0A099L470_COLPS|nr:TraB/GumN family protein [Colwellia psychrerythraea]KGJ96643.1 TraB determinant protein [Colwellia psychrerythraea]